MTIPTITKVMPCPKCINGMMRLEPEEYCALAVERLKKPEMVLATK